MVGRPYPRQQIAYAHWQGIPLRRACVFSERPARRISQFKLDDKDGPILPVMRELAAQSPPYGSAPFVST